MACRSNGDGRGRTGAPSWLLLLATCACATPVDPPLDLREGAPAARLELAPSVTLAEESREEFAAVCAADGVLHVVLARDEPEGGTSLRHVSVDAAGGVVDHGRVEDVVHRAFRDPLALATDARGRPVLAAREVVLVWSEGEWRDARDAPWMTAGGPLWARPWWDPDRGMSARQLQLAGTPGSAVWSVFPLTGREARSGLEWRLLGDRSFAVPWPDEQEKAMVARFGEGVETATWIVDPPDGGTLRECRIAVDAGGALHLFFRGDRSDSVAYGSLSPAEPPGEVGAVPGLPVGERFGFLERGLALAVAPDGAALLGVVRRGGMVGRQGVAVTRRVVDGAVEPAHLLAEHVAELELAPLGDEGAVALARQRRAPWGAGELSAFEWNGGWSRPVLLSREASGIRLVRAGPEAVWALWREEGALVARLLKAAGTGGA